MKPLNEEQVKVIKDFEEFRRNLIKKYSILKMGMSIIQKEFEDILKEREIDNKSLAYGTISLIINYLKYSSIYYFSVNKENMLTEGILVKNVIKNKETAIDICNDFISKIPTHIAELKKYLDKKGCNDLDIDIDDCKQHIDRVMNVIDDITTKDTEIKEEITLCDGFQMISSKTSSGCYCFVPFFIEDDRYYKD